MSQTFLKKLDSVEFSVHHSINCQFSYVVRLVGPGAKCLDNIHESNKTSDIWGFGATLEEAAKNAWRAKEEMIDDLAQKERQRAQTQAGRLTSLRGLSTTA